MSSSSEIFSFLACTIIAFLLNNIIRNFQPNTHVVGREVVEGRGGGMKTSQKHKLLVDVCDS